MKLFQFKKAQTQEVEKIQENAYESLMHSAYEPKYLNECKFIWKTYIPKSGQSDVLQGELLRQLEQLRYEAQDNGNINWDVTFSYFCDWIKDTLCAQSFYTEEEKNQYTWILSYLKLCGEYAKRWNDGEISDEAVDMEKIAYVEDNLYDIIGDAIGYFLIQHPEPIPHQKVPTIYR